ncbi:class I SAM-dependent methyltransferase [Candidatus Altiarchaeota archaeon]
MMEGDWLGFFSGEGVLDFSDEGYGRLEKQSGHSVIFFLKHLPKGSTLLEACCGPGCTAIPLSHYYDVTGFDLDPKVLEHAKCNAGKFGGNIRFVAADYGDMLDVFGPDSFDACSSSGVMDYLDEKSIRRLIELQLQVAPLAFVSVFPGKTASGKEYGFKPNSFTEDDWTGRILAGSNVLDHQVIIHDNDLTELIIALGR